MNTRINHLKAAFFGENSENTANVIGEKLGKAVHTITHTSISDGIDAVKSLATKANDKATRLITKKLVGKELTSSDLTMIKNLIKTGEVPQ